MRPSRSLNRMLGEVTRPRPAREHRSGAMTRPVAEDINGPWPVVPSQRPVGARWLRILLAGMLLVSCKTTIPPPGGPTPEKAPPGVEETPTPPPLPDEDAALRRQQAAAALTERGRRLMAEDRVDPAMRLFEQALSLAPRYGPGYFYLAEAWLSKDNASQARAFHRQAALYLEDNAAWAARLKRQRRHIDRAADGIP